VSSPLAGEVLGPVFADPGVAKVLHGADSDIVWLQVTAPLKPKALEPVNLEKIPLSGGLLWV